MVWLLCVLDGTVLWKISLFFLMVGHTHNTLDRFFSRVMAAVAGRDYFTLFNFFKHVQEGVKHCQIKAEHLSQTWNWWKLQPDLHLPLLHGLGRVHAIQLFRSGGIYMQWKQWCTDQESGVMVQNSLLPRSIPRAMELFLGTGPCCKVCLKLICF